MDHIILGLLLLQPRTIYQLRKRIEEGLQFMYSCSTGSIQAAIKKLLKAEEISIEETIENGRRKKIYCITKKGKGSFQQWVDATLLTEAPKNPELAKIYFMGFSDENYRVERVENYIQELQAISFNLEKICQNGDEMMKNQLKNDILFFQLQTAKFGRDLMEFQIQWYRQFLKELRKRK